MTAPAQRRPQREVSPAGHHILALDGVRGTAILLVLLYHVLGTSGISSSRAVRLLMNLRESGWVGVDLFFCLSGFLITGILFDSVRDPGYFRNFYARRFLRIFPVYYLVVTGLLAMLWLSHQATSAELTPLGYIALFLQNTALYLHHVEGTTVHRYTAHLWSLAVEEQFYLVWPVLVFMVRDRRKLMMLSAALAGFAIVARCLFLAHGTQLDFIYRYTLCRQDALLAGAWLALAVRGPMRERVGHYAKYIFAPVMIALLVEGALTGPFNFDTNRSIAVYGYSLLALAGTSLIAMALNPASTTAALMRLRPLRFLGKYSFGIYILDTMVEESPLNQFVFSMTGSLRGSSKVWPHLVYLASVLLVTIPLAMLSFHFFESPIMKWKRRFSYGARGKP